MFKFTASITSTRRIALTALLASTVTCTNQAFAVDVSEADPFTKKAVSAAREGKLQEAVDLESQAIKEKPKTWLPHATISYFYWLQGNVIDAVTEGQKAIRYAPDNKLALTNLGHIYQSLGTFQEAIPLYEAARKVSGDDWVPWLSLANCYFMSDRNKEGLAILSEMSAKSSDDYNWNYKLGEAYLKVDKPGLAVAPLTRALKLATTQEQKSTCTTQLFVSLLADNQTERAKPMEAQVLNEIRPTDSEPYVRTAAALLPDSDPASGKDLLKRASDNLTQIRDSEGFYKLGRVFAGKALSVQADSTKYNAWLENAAAAFTQAIDLNPRQDSYQIALAGILSRQGKIDQAEKEMNEAKSMNALDPLSPLLAKCFEQIKVQPGATTSGKEAQEGRPPAPVKLTGVRFQINGLSCACHVGRVENALAQMKGVALLNLSHLKPYVGTVVVDPAVISVKDLFPQCAAKAFEAVAEVTKDASFEIISQQQIDSIDDAVRLSQTARYGDVLKFPKQINSPQPVLPLTLVAEHSESKIQ